MSAMSVDSAWLRALALPERSVAQVDHQVAQHQFTAWSQLFAEAPELWNQRLHANDLRSASLYDLCGSPSLDPQAESALEWAAWLVDAWRAAGRCLVFNQTQADTVERFLHVVEPAIAQGVQHLKSDVKQLQVAYTTLPFDAQMIQRLLFLALASRLLDMIMRTCVLELNVARIEGRLAGDSAEQRFQSFITYLQRPEVQQMLLQEYPVLARAVSTAVQQWVTNGVEFLQRLCQDWPTLCATFPQLQATDSLESLVWTGDPHNHGRLVAILTFSGGAKVVYKPRSMAIDAQIQALFGWLNEQNLAHDFRPLAILDRQTYGWVEFVEYAACDSEDQIERFYWRQGAHIALLYALNATDFHAENIIAFGEYPILIDLESLFHPELDQSKRLSGRLTIERSVLRTAMLPQRWWSEQGYDGIDMSGLGGAAGQLSPDALPDWKASTTDSMHMVRSRRTTSAARNRPLLKDSEVQLSCYRDQVCAGFQALYELLATQRADWEAWLQRFALVSIRFIPRTTRSYSTLLHESFHPDVLRDAVERDRLFDRLWFRVPQQPYLADLIEAEQTALRRGDIPFFTTEPASRALRYDDQVLEDFFVQSGLEVVLARAAQLSEADCTRQLWVINRTFDVLEMSNRSADLKLTQQAHIPPLSRSQLLAEAQKLGDQLLLIGFHDEHVWSWLDLAVLSEQTWHVAPIGHDVYGGSAGIALFLAYLGELTGEQRYRETAEQVLTSLIHEVQQLNSPFIGGFSGWGGAIYTLTQLGLLWQRPELLDKAQVWCDEIIKRLPYDQVFDVMGGAAGALLALLNLHEVRPSAELRSVLKQCGDHLVEHALPQQKGVGWVLGEDMAALAGISHGAAGIALALYRLASLTNDLRYREIADAALEYERSLFVPKARNWGDLRGEFDPHNPPLKWAWCHGAPGIGLARAAGLPYADNAAIREDLEHALHSTRERGFGGNHSLCHGDLGNLELFMSAAQQLNDQTLWDEVAALGAKIFASISEHGWLCGVPDGTETPGLMNGLAGIGYMLLRLAEPTMVPSILHLERHKTIHNSPL